MLPLQHIFHNCVTIMKKVELLDTKSELNSGRMTCMLV